MSNRHKEFDAVAWVRHVRDELHERYKHLSAEEFVRKMAEEGRRSEFGRQVASKFGREGERSRPAA